MKDIRYINRPMVVEKIEDLDYINLLFNSKITSKDFWSKSFENNYNKKYNHYNLLRDKVIKQTNNSSDKNIIIQNSNFKGLKYISNVYVNLKTNPMWVDNIVAIEMLRLDIPTVIVDSLDKTTEYVLERIENYLRNT